MHIKVGKYFIFGASVHNNIMAARSESVPVTNSENIVISPENALYYKQ